MALLLRFFNHVGMQNLSPIEIYVSRNDHHKYATMTHSLSINIALRWNSEDFFLFSTSHLQTEALFHKKFDLYLLLSLLLRTQQSFSGTHGEIWQHCIASATGHGVKMWKDCWHRSRKLQSTYKSLSRPFLSRIIKNDTSRLPVDISLGPNKETIHASDPHRWHHEQQRFKIIDFHFSFSLSLWTCGIKLHMCFHGESPWDNSSCCILMIYFNSFAVRHARDMQIVCYNFLMCSYYLPASRGM